MEFIFKESDIYVKYHENDMLDLFSKIDVDDDNHLGRTEFYTYFPKLNNVQPPEQYGYEIIPNPEPEEPYKK